MTYDWRGILQIISLLYSSVRRYRHNWNLSYTFWRCNGERSTTILDVIFYFYIYISWNVHSLMSIHVVGVIGYSQRCMNFNQFFSICFLYLFFPNECPNSLILFINLWVCGAVCSERRNNGNKVKKSEVGWCESSERHRLQKMRAPSHQQS